MFYFQQSIQLLFFAAVLLVLVGRHKSMNCTLKISIGLLSHLDVVSLLQGLQEGRQPVGDAELCGHLQVLRRRNQRGIF